ncbi:hypothetical protein [Spiroplasma eriocheiris]|uniref:Uncharacterized protein n=1 Tax=Spiroplasma eriocheiris TaxID=315358 RepID=A0A0H3XJJ6_9MOLU|nr:hypothetical protein [Spiroplasma eriocheiris]AHF58330.1 hypothetical protein SPE_1218 [Spiroplasma eriocheiris CCTCC M 207170]AKM54765.1 hypothetical protein SERIO_v1c12160 [Spiroplasma eriocheiris]
MPDWGIAVLVIVALILFTIALYKPLMTRIRNQKYKRQRTLNRKITVDKITDNHQHLLLEKAINRPFYKKYFEKLPLTYPVKELNSKVVFNLDIIESDYQDIINLLVQNSDQKYRELYQYLLDTNLNLLLTTIFSQITNQFIIPNFEKLNEEREITNDLSDEYYAKWVLSFREHTIRFICDYYLPIIYQNCLELIKTKDVEKYYINITTAISTRFQEIVFNSLEKDFVQLADRIIDLYPNIGDTMTDDEAKSKIKQIAHKYRVDYDKIFDQHLNQEKIKELLK